MVIGQIQLQRFADGGLLSADFTERVNAVQRGNRGIFADEQMVVQIENMLPFFRRIFFVGMPVGNGCLEMVAAELLARRRPPEVLGAPVDQLLVPERLVLVFIQNHLTVLVRPCLETG